MDSLLSFQITSYPSLGGGREISKLVTCLINIQVVILAILLIRPLYDYYQRRLSYQVSSSGRIFMIWYGTGTNLTCSLTKRLENSMAVFLWNRGYLINGLLL